MESLDSVWQAISPSSPCPEDYSDIDFWFNPERAGWLSKQGEFIRTWRRRWFVLKRGKLLWFKDSNVTTTSKPRGIINVGRALAVKGAEDVINKAHSFQVSIDGWPTYFVADTEKEKEEWVNSIGRSIVQNSSAVAREIVDYDDHPRRRF